MNSSYRVLTVPLEQRGELERQVVWQATVVRVRGQALAPLPPVPEVRICAVGSDPHAIPVGVSRRGKFDQMRGGGKKICVCHAWVEIVLKKKHSQGRRKNKHKHQPDAAIACTHPHAQSGDTLACAKLAVASRQQEHRHILIDVLERERRGPRLAGYRGPGEGEDAHVDLRGRLRPASGR